ncbi:unnamed protein product [Callosobruchus maculatus]|uniref:Uncharacterized protein n=1 Tax=Callosobruchus maculatus TaxID=64391 RepID=A0A653CLS6_CALMS|nr:unnamed protein product [Callosobruchus maculatus]
MFIIIQLSINFITTKFKVAFRNARDHTLRYHFSSIFSKQLSFIRINYFATFVRS